MVIFKIFFTITIFILRITAFSQEPPTYACDDLENPFSCTLTGIQVTRNKPDFYIIAPEPNRVNFLLVNQSTIPFLTDNICSKFPELIDIVVRHVGIEELKDKAFKRCKDLKTIDLRGNNIQVVPEKLLNGLKELKSIWLDNNMIKTFPDNMLIGLPRLLDVSFDQNRVKVFPYEMFKRNGLVRFLRFHSNDLLNLDEMRLMEALPNLESVAFNNNLLSCERHIELHEFFIRNGKYSQLQWSERQRFVKVRDLGKLKCLEDVEWSALFYKRVAEKYSNF